MFDPYRPLIILNPGANRGRTSSLTATLAALCRDLGVEAEIVQTGDVDESRRLVEVAAGMGRRPIIACGGDGTIHAVGNALLDCGAPVPFGIVPAGSGNDYAYQALGLPHLLPAALRVALRGTPRSTDAARLNDRWLINAFGVGMDANVAWDVRDMVEAGRTRLRGEALYTASAIKQVMWHYRDLPLLRIRIDGRTIRPQRMLLTAVMLGPTAGGGYRLTPDADPSDGHLDVLLARRMPQLKALAALPLARAGRHGGLREVRLLRAQHVTLLSPRPVRAHMDGELVSDRRFDIRIVPGALMVMREA
jgi:diacylglycerol kinase (ATP)